MAWVVFLRGVNVGGHKAFRPSIFAEGLEGFDVVNVGAAGTFVVRTSIGQGALRAEFLRKLPFHTEVMICEEADLIRIASDGEFPRLNPDKNVGRFVSILAKRPRSLPPLPISRPTGEAWNVRVVDVPGRFALSLHRRVGRTVLYPNEVVEKALGVAATTRNWNTITAVNGILKAH